MSGVSEAMPISGIVDDVMVFVVHKNADRICIGNGERMNFSAQIFVKLFVQVEVPRQHGQT